MSYNLTGQKISFTYGRVVQVVSGSYYDGYGNLLSLGTSSISASYSLTASYAENATNSQNAQDILIYVKNTSGAIISKGKIVRIIGADNSSNNPTIELADYRNENESANTLGFANQEFEINGFGYVMTEGRLTTVNTQNFTSGDLLYLSSSGNYTNIAPTAPYHGVRLGQVIRSQNVNGSIYVRIDNGQELGESHNVIDTSTTSSYGDLLIKSGSVWINSKNLTGSYIISGSLSTNDGINCTTLTASNFTTTTYAILPHVSSSLNFANDSEAAIGGIPLGGIYRNGNVLQIRLS